MNDYNLPTMVAERTIQQPKRRSIGCVTRGCLLVFTLVALIVVGGAVGGPILFRLLPDQYQDAVVRHVPLLSPWLPTRPYAADFLPTAASGGAAAAMALLNSPTALPSATPTVDPPTAVPATKQPLQNRPAGAQSNIVSSQTPLPPTASISTAAPTGVPATQASAANAVMAVTSTALPTDVPLPPSVHLSGYSIIYQTWNNCGPANLAQVLNAYGLNTTQKATAAWLKPNELDGNVSPWQIVAYVNQFTPYHAMLRVNGSLTLLKRLLAAQFRPLIETGFEIPNNPKEGWMGHYLTPAGYDDGQGVIFGFDSYLGDGSDHQGRREAYNDLDTRWQQFNRTYIVVYPPEREGELRTLLGSDADPTQNEQGAVAQARRDASAAPNNPFAWFNLGSSYVLLHDFKDAATAYDQARNAGTGLPWRMLWYQFGPFSAYYHIGDYKTATILVQATLGTTTKIEELYYWRGLIEAAQNKTQDAIADWNAVIRFNPNYHFAADAIAAVQAGQAPTPPDIP
ncbi:MAG: C39 family peptidase [Aggregatilineales bacterium]